MKINKALLLLMVLLILILSVSAINAQEIDNPKGDLNISDDSINIKNDELISSSMTNDNIYADSTDIYVNSSYVGESDGSMAKPYTSINSGVGAASDGQTVHIFNGQYNDEATITINKNIDIIGESQSGVIVNNAIFKYTTDYTGILSDLTINCAGSATTAAIDIASKAISLNVNNVNINDWVVSGSNSVIISKSTSPVVLDNVNIYNAKGTATSGTAAPSVIFASTSSGGLTIKNSVIENTQFLGTSNTANGAIKCIGSTVNIDNVTIANTTGYTSGLFHLGTNNAIVNVENSKILNNNIQGSASGTTAANGVMFYAAGGSSAKANITVENSVIKDNLIKNHLTYTSYGIVTLNYNIITNNTSPRFVYKKQSSDVVNADYNWWGSNENPYPAYINNVVVMDAYADPSAVLSGKSSTIIADFTKYNESGTLKKLAKNIPDEIVVNFDNEVDKKISNGIANITKQISKTTNVAVSADNEEQNVKVELLPVSVNPMYILENGTVSGSADIIAVNPWTTSGSLQYTIPDDVKEIKSAMVIVNSYSGSGNADNYALHSDVTLTTDSTKTLGSEDLTYSGNQATDPVVYVINDHTTKQYSDYQYTYDILSDISSLAPGSTITVNVANSKYGTKGFDGRIKLIGLFIAYDDGDLDEVTYWLDIGQQWTASSDTITINTASYVGEPDNVTFKSVALSSNLGGNYKFYGEPANDPEYISGNYYKYLTWDLSDIFRPGVNLGYSYDASKEGWGSYKTNLILVTATEEFKYKEIYVSPNGNNDDYGIDWNSAKKDIEVALSLIEDGGTIYVDEGTTFTTSGTSGISIAKNVNIVGRNNNVIIDANNTGIIFNIGAYNVNLTNLTLINGNATNFASKRGAAIFAQGTTLNINNCSFINNTAGPSSSYGGAINLKSTSTTIADSTFEGNTAFYAGGAINAENTNILLDISNTTFTKNGVTNTGWANGGAICSYGTVNINQCIFYNNTLAEGKNGRSINQYDGALTITNSILLDGSNSVYFKTVTSGSVENSWWGNNESNKAVNPKDLGYTNDDIEFYLILNLTKDSNDFIVGDSALITVDLTKNQNGVESVTSLPSLPVTINKSTKVTLENGKATASVVVSELGENVITAEVYGKNASITVNGVAKLDVVYVNGTGGDDGNGLNANTWAGAVKSIDRALILVANGGTIYVADGVTYKKVADDTPITINGDVSIIGQSMENTIISGNNTNRLFNVVSGNVYFENLTIANAVRDTTANTASAAIVSTGNLNLKNVILANNTCGVAGAAVYATGGSLIVSDCIFINNTIARSISRSYGGGAIYSNKVPLSVKNTVFKDNSAFTGGAIYATTVSITLDNCSFYNNRAPGSYSGGGAILIMQTGTSYINNCTFVNNSANDGGAISVTNGHILKLNSSVFADNSATGNNGGGAAYLVTGSSVTNCIFLNNTDAKNGRTISCSNTGASFEDNWWSQNESNKDKNPRGTYGNFVRNVNSYIILNTNVSSTELSVGDSATITLDLTKNQNDVEAGIMPELPVTINSTNGDVNVTNTAIVDGKLTISYTATSSGEGSVTVESYGTVISHVTFDNVMPLPDVVINSATTPWSDGFFAGVGNNLTVTLNNKESVPVDNIVVELYSNESDELIDSYTIDSLAAGSSKVIINDPSVRPITADTVYGAYNNNIVRYTVNVTYNGKVLDSKSYNKKLAYDGYFNKTYAYGGHDNQISRNYTISGDIVIESQPLSKYADQYTRQRTETWDIAIPDDSTLVKAFLYFNYNWDTSFFPDGWNLTFNENEITNDYIAWDTDQGNLGYYGSYRYGIVVFDVSDYFVNGENTFNITKTGNCALYPSTLVLLYNSTGSKTIKDVYFTDICDVLYNYYNPGYTNLTNVYAPYNNINVTNLQEAHWYVFAGSASGTGDGDLSFNGKRFNGIWSPYSSDNTCFAYDANVSDVIGKNNDAWYLTDLSRMSTVVVYEQILVVTKSKDLPTAETTVKSEYTSVPTVYAGVNNTITVTVKNTGISARDVVVTLKIGDEVIGTETLADYEAGETYTLTFVDTTIRPVTENTVNGNNNEYMNYTVVVENSEGVLINETNSSFVILYNGNLGKDYEYPNANPLLREYNITGDVIVVNGSQYAGSSVNVNDVITVKFDGDVAEALLYISYNWNNPSLGDFTSWNITFNNIVIAPIANYKDQGNMGNYGKYAYGLVVYNVTGLVVNGENALSINRTPKNVAIYPASLLVLTNDESSLVQKTVYILEEVDLLSKTYNKNLPAGFNSTFDVADGNATLYVFAASAQAGEGNLIVNNETYTDVWKGTANSVEVFTSDVDAGNIKVYFESTGGTILALHQIVVVSNDLPATAETTVKSEYTSVPTVYAGVNNTITVTVKNTGKSAKDVVVTLKIGDEVIGTETLADYEAGETYTLTFVDTTIRPVTENTVNGNNNEYMNYTVVVENSEGVLINETNSSFVILYNGNLGKDYEYPNANPLLREYNITGDVIVANGSQYAGSSVNVNDVITVKFDGDVAEALLYISYNWNNPSLGDFTSWNITFNNIVIAPIANYKDQGNLGNYGKYAYGLVVYNVTGLVVNGENALSINRTPKNVAIYPASLLVLTNDDSSDVEKTVYILEEVDLLSKTYNKNLPAGFNTAFDVVDGNATLYVFAASAQKGEGNLIVNGETYTDVWDGSSESVEVFTSDVDAGNIKVYFESTGATILALHQIVVVSNERLPEIDVSALKTPWNDGIYAAVDNNLTVTINNKQSRILENVIIELYSNESDELIATYTIDSLAPGISSIVINDPTIRKLTESTVWPAAQNNKIAYNVIVKYANVEIFNKSFNKMVAYNGYFNKTYAYNGSSNKIIRNYTITGDIIVASQPEDVYMDQFSRQRNETWNISVPDDSTLVKAFLYFNYNWDTSYFPDGWTLTFNGNTITDKYIFWDTDKGNLGYWGNYIYGTLVFDVTEYFNNGENIFDITKTGNCALYPSTLVVLYNTTGSKTIKDVYFTDICDVLYGYYNSEYTNLTNVYVPYNGINTTDLKDASWYVFAGSADGQNDGNISFNGKTFDNLWIDGSTTSCYAYIANVTDVIGENNNAWYLTNPKLMTTVVVYEQILVVTRARELPTAETTVKSEYTSVPTVYAGVNNTITVTVKNTGVSAKDVVVTLKIGDEVIGTETLADYEAGETYTLTFVDTTIRPVTENTVNGNNNEYMNYTVVVEDSEGVLINETNSSFVILYNGNLGKDYEYPNANPLLREYNITGDVIVANGSQYAGSSDNVDDVITVKFDGDVAEALLYVSYNWNNPSLGDFTSWNITFNNKVITPIANYKDQGNIGNYGKYAYGLVVYNVTGLVVNGENALSIIRTPKNVAIYPASLLVLTNDDSSDVEKTVYILEEVDLLSKTYNKNLPAGFVSAFDVIDGNATLYVFAASAEAGEGNLIVKGENYTDVWNGTSKSVESFITVVDAGDIDVYFESTGGTILALHQIVVVENHIIPKENLTLEASAKPITAGEDATIVVTGFKDATGNVTVTVSECIYTAEIVDGTATVVVSGLTENATALISYPGDDKYNNASATVDIVVNPKEKENATISIDAPSQATEGDNVTVTVTLPEDATGNVTIGNEVVPVVNGTASAVLTNVPAGNTTVPITYSGDDKYNPIETEVTINVDEKPVPPKENLTLEASADPITVGEDAVIVVTGFEDATGNVTAKVGNGVYTTSIVDGTATFTISGLIENVTADITYAGDDKYNSASATVDIVVNPKEKENATISIDAPSQATEGDNVTVTVTLPEDATGNVTIGNEVVPVVNGTASAVLTNIPAGNTTVPITYSGDDKYNPIETKVTINVDEKPVPPKEDLNASVSVDPITVGEDAVIVVSDLKDATGNVTVVVNGKTYTAPINDGKATITVSGLTENATALISYLGDDKYNNFTDSVNIVVNPKEKENATITIDVPPVTEGQNTTVNVELPKDATGNVTAVVDGKTYTAPVKDGKATITIPDLAAGNYNVPVTYSGDDKYNPLTEEVNITVDEDKSDIVKAPDVTKYFSGPERFVVTVTDYQGKPLANKSVTISINGRSYDRTTDATGTASIALGLNSGVYNATVTVDNKTINSVVTILSTVNGTDIIKVFRNATQYYATFRDGEGNYLKDGETVIFNIHGVMYERKVSGDKGLARLNINLEAGEYIITAMNPITGDMAANNITVLSRITENADLVKYYRNASQYTVKVIGDDGKAVGAGESVTFNINGVFYTRQTDANGIAKININLQPGDYVITSEYKGCLVSNNIKVLPVLTASDISMKYRDGTQFKANLVDGQGKPYPNQAVSFNINGVFYNRATDSTGTAKLNINLMPGEYIITSSYNGASIANTIKISA